MTDNRPDSSHSSMSGLSRESDEEDKWTFTSSRSLASEVTRYRYENGRRYHAYRDGQYYQPNDEKHQTHESIVHHLWLLTLEDRLFLAPIDNPQHVLDVGTGTGLWAIDVGDRFPSSEVIGTDLSPTQSPYAPPNVRFEIDDCCSEWTYPANSFDLIHIRDLLGSVSDWPAFYRECYKHAQPGGFIEHVEVSICNIGWSPDTPEQNQEPFRTFTSSFLEAGKAMGKTFEICEQMKYYISNAGFVDVQEHTFDWPIGDWIDQSKGAHGAEMPWSLERTKQIGSWNMRNWLDGCEGWMLAPSTRALGWTFEEVQLYLRRLKASIKDVGPGRGMKWNQVRVVWGRKPEM